MYDEEREALLEQLITRAVESHLRRPTFTHKSLGDAITRRLDEAGYAVSETSLIDAIEVALDGVDDTSVQDIVDRCMEYEVAL